MRVVWECCIGKGVGWVHCVSKGGIRRDILNSGGINAEGVFKEKRLQCEIVGYPQDKQRCSKVCSSTSGSFLEH